MEGKPKGKHIYLSTSPCPSLEIIYWKCLISHISFSRSIPAFGL
jgi:hypothetical protein